MSSRARNTLIGGATTAAVAAVVLLIVFTGHHGTDTKQGQRLTVPAMTFKLQATVKAVLDGDSNQPSCALADAALSAVTDVFGNDTDNPSAAVADAKKAIDEADAAALTARTPAVRSAVAAMQVHLTALRDAAQVNDVGQEASVLLSIRDDMTAVYGACAS